MPSGLGGSTVCVQIYGTLYNVFLFCNSYLLKTEIVLRILYFLYYLQLINIMLSIILDSKYSQDLHSIFNQLSNLIVGNNVVMFVD